VIIDSFVQSYVSPDILGRVISVTWAVGFAMMPVGALLAGGLATALGIRAALWMLTALVAASGLTFLLTPMRHLRDLPRRPAELASRPCQRLSAAQMLVQASTVLAWPRLTR
jgi:hypothetical protein